MEEMGSQSVEILYLYIGRFNLESYFSSDSVKEVTSPFLNMRFNGKTYVLQTSSDSDNDLANTKRLISSLAKIGYSSKKVKTATLLNYGKPSYYCKVTLCTYIFKNNNNMYYYVLLLCIIIHYNVLIHVLLYVIIHVLLHVNSPMLYTFLEPPKIPMLQEYSNETTPKHANNFSKEMIQGQCILLYIRHCTSIFFSLLSIYFQLFKMSCIYCIYCIYFLTSHLLSCIFICQTRIKILISKRLMNYFI